MTMALAAAARQELQRPSAACHFPVDHEFVFRWRFRRQIGRLGAAQNLVHLCGGPPVVVADRRAVGHQGTGFDVFLPHRHRRQAMPRRQCGKLGTPGEKHGAGPEYDAAGSVAFHRDKRLVELIGTLDPMLAEYDPGRACRPAGLFNRAWRTRIGLVEQDSKARRARQGFVQQRKSLPAQAGRQVDDAGHVRRSIRRSRSGCHDDRQCRCRAARQIGSRRAGRHKNVDIAAGQLSSPGFEPRFVSVGPAKIKADVFAFNPAEFFQPLLEHVPQRKTQRVRPGHFKDADAPDCPGHFNCPTGRG